MRRRATSGACWSGAACIRARCCPGWRSRWWRCCLDRRSTETMIGATVLRLIERRRGEAMADREASVQAPLILGPEDTGRAVSAEEFASAEFVGSYKYERVGGRLIV